MVKKMYVRYRRKFWLIYQLSKRAQDFAGAVKYYFAGLYNSLDEHHVFLFAGGLAFSILLCVIPFILILFWVLGNFLNSETISSQLGYLVDTVIPYEDYSYVVKEVLENRARELIQFRNTAGILGMGGLLFAASGFAGSIRTILNNIFGAKVDVNFFLGKLRDFVLIFVSVVLMFAVTLVAPVLTILRTFSEQFVELEFLKYRIFQTVFTSAISTSIILILFSMLYHFVPIKRIKFQAVFVGAMWAAILWEGAKQIFGYYLYNIAVYGKIYGAYAILVAVAFWLYYSAAVFVIGAVIGELYNRRLTENGTT